MSRALSLESPPRLLLAVNPPRGLDVGSARFVDGPLQELASAYPQSDRRKGDAMR